MQFQLESLLFAGNADVSSALSAEHEMIFRVEVNEDGIRRACRRVADGDVRAPS
jgi:hypothetical protein